MTQQRSLFGVNLLSQFVAFLLLAGLAGQLPPGLRELASLAGSLLFTIFLFGGLYGIFRALGARSAGLEWFYQRFPLGLFAEKEEDAPPAAPEAPRDGGKGFDWKALCSFKTLRFAGVMLIVTAAFSLLFNIEWRLAHKVLVALFLGLLSMGAAEFLRRGSRASWSALLSVIGFALLQFALTLLSLYAVEAGWALLLQNPHTWLTLKFLLTCACLFTLWRYPAEVHPLLYFTVAYVSPLSLLYAGSSLDFPIGLVFVALLTAIVVTYSTMHRYPALWILNTVAANTFVYFLFAYEVGYGGNPVPASVLALIAFAAFFAVHLAVAVSAARDRERLERLEHVHLIVIHVLAAAGAFVLRDTLPILGKYLGIAYLAIGLAAFVASLVSAGGSRDRLFNELLLNLAIVFSTLGLFVQTTGPWSAIVFLLYACAVLWYSLRTPTIRTRVYGFIILGISLVKLYLQFSEIFDSIPGSIAVLLIGVTLVALSYKFEALKDLVLHGIRNDRVEG